MEDIAARKVRQAKVPRKVPRAEAKEVDATEDEERMCAYILELKAVRGHGTYKTIADEAKVQSSTLSQFLKGKGTKGTRTATFRKLEVWQPRYIEKPVWIQKEKPSTEKAAEGSEEWIKAQKRKREQKKQWSAAWMRKDRARKKTEAPRSTQQQKETSQAKLLHQEEQARHVTLGLAEHAVASQIVANTAGQALVKAHVHEMLAAAEAHRLCRAFGESEMGKSKFSSQLQAGGLCSV
jgi:hypothetical protein